MFNLFKSKETQEVSKQVLTDKKYSSDIEQIHHEFSIAGDELLKEAELVLATVIIKNTEKANILRSLGFNNVKEVKETIEKEENIKVNQETADLIKSYKEKYPFNRFIDEAGVERICKKYNLVCGDVNLYQGFVPEINLKQIERFTKNYQFNIWKGRTGDPGNFTDVYFDASNFEIRKRNSYYHFFPKDSKSEVDWAYQSNDTPDLFYGRISYKRESSKTDTEFVSQITKQGLKICAPIKDMNTKGMNLNGYKLEKHIPDPVVLQPIKGGYLIVTAWGDEASDEEVTNSINN